MSHLTVTRLTSQNYRSWKSIISCYLLEEDVNIGNANLSAKLNAKGLRIIRSSVSEEVLPHIEMIESVKETWEKLASMYGGDNAEVRIRKLLQLFTAKKKRNESIKEFIGKMKRLCNEVNEAKREENIDIIPNELLACAIIQGLPDSMQAAVKRWSAKEISVENLELKLEGLFEEDTTEGILVVDRNIKYDMKGVKCYRCQEIGHYARNCSLKQSKGVSSLGILAVQELPPRTTKEKTQVVCLTSKLEERGYSGEAVEDWMCSRGAFKSSPKETNKERGEQRQSLHSGETWRSVVENEVSQNQ